MSAAARIAAKLGILLNLARIENFGCQEMVLEVGLAEYAMSHGNLCRRRFQALRRHGAACELPV